MAPKSVRSDLTMVPESGIASLSPSEVALIAQRAVADYIATRNPDAIVAWRQCFGPAECGELLAIVANGDKGSIEPAKVVARKTISFVHAPVVALLVDSLDPDVCGFGCELAFILSMSCSEFDPLIINACRRQLQLDAHVPLSTIKSSDLTDLELILKDLFECAWFSDSSLLPWMMRSSLRLPEAERRRRLVRKLWDGSRRINGPIGSPAWYVSRASALSLARDGVRLEFSQSGGDDEELSRIIEFSQGKKATVQSMTAFDAAVELVLGGESLAAALSESMVRNDVIATAGIIDSIGEALNDVMPSLGHDLRDSSSVFRLFESIVSGNADPLCILKACIEWPSCFRKSSILLALSKVSESTRLGDLEAFGINIETILAIAEVASDDDGLCFFKRLSAHVDRRISTAALAAASAVGDEESAKRLAVDALRRIRTGESLAEAGSDLIMATRSRSSSVLSLLEPISIEHGEVASYSRIALMCAVGFTRSEAESYFSGLSPRDRVGLGRSLVSQCWETYLADGVRQGELPIPHGVWRTRSSAVLEAVRARLSEQSLGEDRLLSVAELAASGDAPCRAEMWDWITQGSIGFLERLRGDLLMVAWDKDCFAWWRSHATTTRDMIFSCGIPIERSFFEIFFGDELQGIDMETMSERMERGLMRYGGDWKRSQVIEQFVPVPR